MSAWRIIAFASAGGIEDWLDTLSSVMTLMACLYLGNEHHASGVYHFELCFCTSGGVN